MIVIDSNHQPLVNSLKNRAESLYVCVYVAARGTVFFAQQGITQVIHTPNAMGKCVVIEQ